jgi:prevent-host-death family protein
MQTINISDFRANLLKYLEAAGSGEQILVTSNGKLLASITAPEDKKEIAKKQLNSLATTAKIHDVIAPTESEWVVLQ